MIVKGPAHRYVCQGLDHINHTSFPFLIILVVADGYIRSSTRSSSFRSIISERSSIAIKARIDISQPVGHAYRIRDLLFAPDLTLNARIYYNGHICNETIVDVLSKHLDVNVWGIIGSN
jgi:hypothetical protein